MSKETMHLEVRNLIMGLFAGIFAGVLAAGFGIALPSIKHMDKEVRACLQLPTIHEARRCWGEEP